MANQGQQIRSEKIRKIVQVSLQDPNHMTGGQGVVVRDISRGLIEAGFDVDYISIRLVGEQERNIYCYPEGSFCVHRLSVSDSDTIRTPYEGLEIKQLERRREFFHLACSYIRRHYSARDTVLHLHGFYNVPLMAGVLPEFNSVSTYHLLLSKRLKRTLENDGSMPIELLRMLETTSFYANKKIQAISPGMKAEILEVAHSLQDPDLPGEAFTLGETLGIHLHGFDKNGPALENRIRIIPNGIGNEFFLPKCNETTPTLVAAWGRISNEKGFEHLIEAAGKMPDVRFKIWGTTGDTERKRLDYRKKLEILAHTHKNILLDFRPNGVRNEELLKYIDEAEIVVVPSIYEPFGLVIIEAMARGKPVVTTATEGGKFIMNASLPAQLPYGYLISQNSDELSLEIVNSLTHFFSMSPNKRTTMCEAAKERASCFRLSSIVKQLIEFYAA